LCIAVAATLALAACGSPQESAPTAASAPASAQTPEQAAPAATPAQAVAVAAVDRGNAVDSSLKVSAPLSTFAPNDTIYVSVSTTGSAKNASLIAKWTYQDGQLVNEAMQTIAPDGDAVTNFHVSKPDGWPVGSYKVEISLDDKLVATRAFLVREPEAGK
jgi:hypothetical protein